MPRREKCETARFALDLGRRRFLGAALGAAGVLLSRPAFSAAPLRTGDRAPRTALPDLAGRQVIIPDGFPGMALIVHFWGSWCSSCKGEMAAIEKVRALHGAKTLAAFSVNVGETREKAARFVEDARITYPVLLDASYEATKAYGVSAIPTTFLIGSNGTVRFKILGEIDVRGLQALLSRTVR